MRQTIVVCCAFLAFYGTSCNSKSVETKTYPYKNQYITGTINGNKTPERLSPYAILFRDSMKAVFVNSTKAFPSMYSLEKDTIVVRTDDKEKVMKFWLQNGQVSAASYVALANEPKPNADFTIKGYLGKVPANNVFAGKNFKGNLFKMGVNEVFNPDFAIEFNAAGTSFGEKDASGKTDASQYAATIYDNIAFRYQQGSTRIIGARIKDSVVYFKESGLYYWGTLR